MKEAVQKVRSALSKQDLNPNLTHFLVHDGYIAASNGRMVAATPFPVKESFLVPGEDFATLVDRLGNDIQINITDSKIILTSGKMRGSLSSLPIDLMYYQIPDKSLWRPAPQDFLSSLKRIRPFISDNATRAWSLCAYLEQDVMLASNNISLVEVSCNGLGGGGTLLPCWAVDFLLSHPNRLSSVQFQPTYACFKWDDDSWLRTSLVEDLFPLQASEMLKSITLPKFVITKEWMTAYNRVADVSDGKVSITSNKIIGLREKDVNSQFEVEYEIDSDTPIGGVSHWNPKFLTPVIDCATHWDISAWPAASAFIGDGIRGIVTGRV